MLYRSLFPRDVFTSLDRLQREMQGLFDGSPAIRGPGLGGYPALNVGTTPSSVEVHAFAPGLDPATIDLNLDRGVLTLSGERKGQDVPADDKGMLHMQERFAGRFRRVVNLPDDIDPNGITAEYRDGVLRVSIKRRDAVQPRRITIQ